MGLRRDEVDIEQARFWLRWLENGLSVGQPLGGDELRAIKRYLATRADRLPWLLAGLDVLPGRYGNAGRCVIAAGAALIRRPRAWRFGPR